MKRVYRGECSQCSDYLTAIASADHFRAHRLGREARIWRCGICSFQSSAFRETLTHVFHQGHSLRQISSGVQRNWSFGSNIAPIFSSGNIANKVLKSIPFGSIGSVESRAQNDSTTDEDSNVTTRTNSKQELRNPFNTTRPEPTVLLQEQHDGTVTFPIDVSFHVDDYEESDVVCDDTNAITSFPKQPKIEEGSNSVDKSFPTHPRTIDHTKSVDNYFPARPKVCRTCQKCQKTLNPKKSHVRHVLLKHTTSCFNISPYACSSCGNIFKQRDNFGNHLRSDIGQKCGGAKAVPINKEENDERMKTALAICFPDYAFEWMGFK